MPVERSIHGPRAPGNRFRAASRSPPCARGSASGACVIGMDFALLRRSGFRMFAELALTALATEVAFGFPDAIYRRIGHPVSWLGVLIARREDLWNRRKF